MDECVVEGCEKSPRSGSAELCNMHYYRLRRTGTTDKINRTSDPTVRLQARLHRELSGCLVWNGTVNKNGYGTLWAWGKTWSTHRLAWTLWRGPIPPGLFVCHHCDNPPCCDPEHLFLGTVADNNADCRAKNRSIPIERLSQLRRSRTHCKQGHPFDEENTYVTTKGERACRTCRRAWAVKRNRRATEARRALNAAG